jgi:hypothetical protein
VTAGVKAHQIPIDELPSIFQLAYDKAALEEQNMPSHSFIVKDTFKDFVERKLSASAGQ